MAATPDYREELLALADEIEKSEGLMVVRGPFNGDGYQLGIKKTAATIAALRTAALPKQDGVSREELAIEVMNVRRRIHGLDDLDLPTLRRIKRDAGINEAFAIADALLARHAAGSADDRDWEFSPDDIRALGWMVAVHNDYRQLGELHTFWLFTKDGRAVKGEGMSDTEALNKVRAALSTTGALKP